MKGTEEAHRQLAKRRADMCASLTDVRIALDAVNSVGNLHTAQVMGAAILPYYTGSELLGSL